MKMFFLVMSLCLCPFLQAGAQPKIQAQTQTMWFNIMGDTTDASVNTIEVDPTPVSIDRHKRVMRVRVSRSADRVSWYDVPYRSYVSEVMFDCATNSARYLSIDYYRQPFWTGELARRVTFGADDYRAMRFLDVEPNPYQIIIRAVCQTGGVTHN